MKHLKNVSQLKKDSFAFCPKCSLTFKVGYVIKKGAYFETRRNYNIPLLISKSENVISCQ